MAAVDPGEPTFAGRRELILLSGFVLCLIIATLTVVWPELSGGESSHTKPQSTRSATEQSR